MLHWKQIPHSAKEEKTKFSMINARCETVATKPAYRTVFRQRQRQRQCLVPTSGFFVETDRPPASPMHEDYPEYDAPPIHGILLDLLGPSCIDYELACIATYKAAWHNANEVAGD